MKTYIVGVYGTLISGQGNHHVMTRARGVKLGDTLTKPEHTLVSLGGFPGLITNETHPEGNTAVKLEIWEVDEDGLQVLNGLEGHRSRKHPSNFYDIEDVETEDFGTVSVYTLGTEYLSRPKIVNGDWVNRILE